MTIALCGFYLAAISNATSNLGLIGLQMYKLASITALQASGSSTVGNPPYANLSLRINGVYSKNLNGSTIMGYVGSGFYCLFPS